MVKRKRNSAEKDEQSLKQPSKVVKPTLTPATSASDPATATTVQIVTGSYERVLHGFTATIPTIGAANDAPSTAQFVDTFLFQAHASAIRCLALSPLSAIDPSEPRKLMLASGGTDERINLYSLAASPAAVNDEFPAVPTLAGNKILENPKNRELGSLLHHYSAITALHFPSRSKLLAAAEDNTISVTKTRDWTVVSTIKAPRPKAQGRPSGDTAPAGTSPSGINDFAVHPSMKLMLSVGRGERCMRLWNLLTGKKAGVLNFSKEVLQGIKEGKHSTGEGRKIEWNAEGDQFAVAFDKGVVVFGTDSTPICRVLSNPVSKVHQIRYVTVGPCEKAEFLAVSTEDGRIIFYAITKLRKAESRDECSIDYAEAIAQLGGRSQGSQGRVKDFEILTLNDQSNAKGGHLLVVTGNSDGSVRIWLLDGKELMLKESDKRHFNSNGEDNVPVRQIGKLLGCYETGNRITCLKAFVMLQQEKSSTVDDAEVEVEVNDSSESESSNEGSDAA